MFGSCLVRTDTKGISYSRSFVNIVADGKPVLRVYIEDGEREREERERRERGEKEGERIGEGIILLFNLNNLE